MINTVTEINEAAKKPEALIEAAEKQYYNEIKSVAKRIADNDDIKIVALAGPSASGKTTTAHILKEILTELGEKVIIVSLDDFYLEPEKSPLLPDGSMDIESVNALNIPLINKCFGEIITYGKTMLPRFDFVSKSSIENDREADITDRGIIVVEGLHALNPLITDLVPKENIFKCYISVNCSILDSFGEQLLSSRQIRLARRTIRDKRSRGASITDTLSLWNGVVAGERKYLYCFKQTADAQIKTLHIYEPCLYKKEILRLKAELTPDTVCYDYFMRTAAAIEKFEDIDTNLVPNSSLIREFIGEGEIN